jgi:hypothetical protein
MEDSASGGRPNLAGHSEGRRQQITGDHAVGESMQARVERRKVKAGLLRRLDDHRTVHLTAKAKERLMRLRAARRFTPIT